MKIGLLANHPAPYRDTTLNLLIEQHKDITLDVLCLKEVPENHTEWQYSASVNFRTIGRRIALPVVGDYCKNTVKTLKKGKYDLLIINGNYPATMLTAILYCWLTKTPYIFCCDSIEQGPLPRKLQNLIYKKAGAFWVPGNRTKEFIQTYGISDRIIFQGSYLNDFTPILETVKNSDRTSFRKQLGISENEKMFLFVGNLIRKRNIGLLLNASKALELKYSFKTVIIGDGEDREQVVQTAADSKSIIYVGKVPYSQLHEYYGAADAYVHPGREPYSLAFMEAAVTGLYLIASARVGAVYDVLYEGENGKVFNSDDPDSLQNAMADVLNDRYSKEGVLKIQNYLLTERNNPWAADQLWQAIQCATAGE